MAFKTYGNEESTQAEKPKVDYDALNKYVVETAGLQERETLTGYISGIVDLGIQDQEDAEMEFKGSAEDEAAEIAKYPQTYFKDGFNENKKPCRLKCWPQAARQAVAVSVDFPDIILDKGQFFGESNPQPLRMWLGGSFYLEGVGMVIGRPTVLKINKSQGFWSFDKKHLFHKMAVAAKLIKPDEAFLPQDIDKLLGQAFQFETQVFFKEHKGKEYFTEYVKYSTGLGRNQSAPEIVNPPFVVEFDGDNSEEALSNLRWHVINTIKRAKNYNGSKIQSQLGDEASEEEQAQEAPQKPSQASAASKPKPTPSKPVKEAPKPSTGFEDMDDDTPF